MVIHLILLVVNRVGEGLTVKVATFSDCLGALKKVATLSANRILTNCRHSDILKNIMVNCSDLTFDRKYSHVKAHQDDGEAYSDLEHPAQLNCQMDAAAKQVIWG